MIKRKTVAYRRIRDWLFRSLGEFCVMCGTDLDLTFDCVIPRGDLHHKLSSDQRARFYRDQARKNNVVVLCRRCNSRKGRGELPRYLGPRVRYVELPRGVSYPTSPE